MLRDNKRSYIIKKIWQIFKLSTPPPPPPPPIMGGGEKPWCYSACTSLEPLAYLLVEMKIWCWLRQEGEVYLLGDFSMGEGGFFPGGENEQIFARLPPTMQKGVSAPPFLFYPPS